MWNMNDMGNVEDGTATKENIIKYINKYKLELFSSTKLNLRIHNFKRLKYNCLKITGFASSC